MPRFSHVYEIAFTVVSEKEDGSDVTAEMVRGAIARRVQELPNDELVNEAIAGPGDTYEIEEAK